MFTSLNDACVADLTFFEDVASSEFECCSRRSRSAYALPISWRNEARGVIDWLMVTFAQGVGVVGCFALHLLVVLRVRI